MLNIKRIFETTLHVLGTTVVNEYLERTWDCVQTYIHVNIELNCLLFILLSCN